MAVLSNTDRKRIWAHWMRQDFGPVAITKTDLQAAVNAIDDFLEANASNINQAFPTASRTGLTTAQKAAIVGYVALRRANLLVTAED